MNIYKSGVIELLHSDQTHLFTPSAHRQSFTDNYRRRRDTRTVLPEQTSHRLLPVLTRATPPDTSAPETFRRITSVSGHVGER